MTKWLLSIFFLWPCVKLVAQESKKPPSFYIAKIEISGEAVFLDSILNTDYYHNNLKVIFQDNNLNSDWKYRLFNMEVVSAQSTEWKAIKESEVNILNLYPGKYEFQISKLSDGILKKEMSLKIIVDKPWYRTWWFWALGFFCVFAILYSREKAIKSQEEEEQEQQKRIIELELRTLQLQMNPHFIFNALNSIQSYIMKKNTFLANDYLTKFALLIRMFLDSSRNKYITISEELHLLQLYIEMEKLRFENSFEYHIYVDPDLDKLIEIPTMVLQPFVENSINHGLRYKKKKGTLEIRFEESENIITCTIKDDGVGRKRSKEIQTTSRKGYISQGLKITEERLETYNRINETNIEFSLNDVEIPDGLTDIDLGTIVTIRFPKTME